jgi:hypothetical protein
LGKFKFEAGGRMEIDLKKENSKTIFLLMAASLVCSAFIQMGTVSLTSLINLVVIGSGSVMFSAVSLMITNIIPQGIKHKLLFTRLKNELPACRIDTLCQGESRIEFSSVKSKWPDVFADDITPNTRNSRWYQQIYKPVKDAKEVLQAHRSFLLYRDTFSGLLLILLATAIWSITADSKILGEIKPLVFGIQGFFMLLAFLAARVSGNRFVVNAVAAAE